MPTPVPVPIVAGNWKMNTDMAGAVELATGVGKGAAALSGVEMVLCPPFVFLAAVRDAVEGTSVKIGAQNMHGEESGAFTGETAASMLQGLCEYVILGHSERRQLFGETDELVNLKVNAAFQKGLIPILCVGETLEQREAGQAQDTISKQVRAGLAGIVDITGLVVAYEPVWAIGTGQAATPEIAAEVMGGAILETLHEHFDNHDFFFIHYKPADAAGEDGDFEAKVKCLEELDPYISQIRELNPDVLMVAGDHSTPAIMAGHSWHPVPFMLHSKLTLGEGVPAFNERACAQGSVGRIPATQIMLMALAHAGKLAKFGP